jgi:N-acetylneuraminic acid mutarotase
MKSTFLFGYFVLAGAMLVAGCHSSSTTTTLGNWIRRSDFNGVARSGAVCFVIGDTAYVGTGFDGTNRLSDFWKFDPTVNGGYGGWIQIADFPCVARNGAVGFGVNGKGYVTTGYDGNNYLNDCWMYDPATNSWTQKASMPTNGRFGAVAFALDGKGYVTTGYDGNYLKDFWEYDPATDQWTLKPNSLGGTKRMYAMSFVINDTAYVVGGVNNGSLVADFWAYDPSQDTWIRKRDIANTSSASYDDNYTSIERQQGAAFVINDTAYIATGMAGSNLNTTWQYDPKVDLWTQRTNIEFQPRVGAVGFSVKNRGFIALGTPSQGSLIEYDDLREFQPNVPDNTTDD